MSRPKGSEYQRRDNPGAAWRFQSLPRDCHAAAILAPNRPGRAAELEGQRTIAARKAFRTGLGPGSWLSFSPTVGRKPSHGKALVWMKTSALPADGALKPKPRSSLQRSSVPVSCIGRLNSVSSILDAQVAGCGPPAPCRSLQSRSSGGGNTSRNANASRVVPEPRSSCTLVWASASSGRRPARTHHRTTRLAHALEPLPTKRSNRRPDTRSCSRSSPAPQRTGTTQSSRRAGCTGPSRTQVSVAGRSILDSLGYATDSRIVGLVFPDPHDDPALPKQRAVRRAVAPDILGEFLFPPGAVALRLRGVEWAGMPETSVHEHGNPDARERDVDAAARARYGIVDPEAVSEAVESAADPEFGTGVASLLRRHPPPDHVGGGRGHSFPSSHAVSPIRARRTRRSMRTWRHRPRPAPSRPMTLSSRPEGGLFAAVRCRR